MFKIFIKEIKIFRFMIAIACILIVDSIIIERLLAWGYFQWIWRILSNTYYALLMDYSLLNYLKIMLLDILVLASLFFLLLFMIHIFPNIVANCIGYRNESNQSTQDALSKEALIIGTPLEGERGEPEREGAVGILGKDFIGTNKREVNTMFPKNPVEISALLGKTITSIEGMEKDDYEIIFTCSDGTKYKMYHHQSCSEHVYIEDVCGNVEDLLNTPITLAEDVSSLCDKEELDKGDNSYTWTWYKLATVKGYVSIRWYGTSNGCYAEDVDFVKVE